jgi:alanyl-tRNA synthetase
MEEHGEKSGPDGKQELFKSGPLDGLKKALHGTEFLGYDTMEAQAKVVGLIAHDQLCDQIDEVNHAEPIIVVLDRTPFYGESGGQMGDTGEIVGDGFRFQVIDAQKESNFILHRGHLRSGITRQGVQVKARVDADRRQGIRRAHSATHILHYALQRHLGKHAQQQGSKVDRDWLRFDFANPRSVSRDELAKIEDEVNAQVVEAAPVSWTTLPIAEARQAGAMMLFGEKYPDVVRMVSMGEFSKELCGGTHLDNTGQVGLFRIVGEESVAAGTRRITAVTGPEALSRSRKNEVALAEAAAVLRVPPADVPDRVAALVKEVRDLKKQLASGGRVGGASADELLSSAVEVGGAKLIVAELPEAGADALRQLIDQLRRKAGPCAVLLASHTEGKVVLVAGITKDLESKGMNAGAWVREAAAVVGGSGGGRADMAQAGGKHPEKLPAALEAASASAQKRMGS